MKELKCGKGNLIAILYVSVLRDANEIRKGCQSESYATSGNEAVCAGSSLAATTFETEVLVEGARFTKGSRAKRLLTCAFSFRSDPGVVGARFGALANKGCTRRDLSFRLS